MIFILLSLILSQAFDDVNDFVTSVPSDFIYGASFPFRLDKRGWVITTTFLSLTGLTVYLDENINKRVGNYCNKNPQILDFSSRLSKLGKGEWGGLIIATMGAVGYTTNNRRLQNTFWLSLESALLSSAYSDINKILFGRERPYSNSQGDFKGPCYGIKGSEYHSFPSGHASLAFSIGTVVAEQYSDNLWVKVLVYTLASGIALSRVIENKHYLSDVIVGSAIGYATAKMVISLH